MDECGHLFHAQEIYAYVASDESLVVAADVWMDPFHDAVHFCPNPLAMPEAMGREFILAATTRRGGPLGRVMLNRVYSSFAPVVGLKSVVVYTAGIDAPMRNEVAVGPPPPALPLAATEAPPPLSAISSAAPANGPIELTGFSASYSLEAALDDVMTQALARFPAPPRNPDIGVRVTVKEISVGAGGNFRPGLTVKATVG